MKDQIKQELSKHYWSSTDGHCACGVLPEKEDSDLTSLRGHMADAILPIVTKRIREAEEATREECAQVCIMEAEYNVVQAAQADAMDYLESSRFHEGIQKAAEKLAATIRSTPTGALERLLAQATVKAFETAYTTARGADDGDDRFRKHGAKQQYWKGRSDVASELRKHPDYLAAKATLETLAVLERKP